MSATTKQERAAGVQTGWYPSAEDRWWQQSLLPGGYVGKVVLALGGGILISVLSLATYLLAVEKYSLSEALPLLLVDVLATALGGALTLLALRSLLGRITLASDTLRSARLGGAAPTLPTNLDDAGGQLLTETQYTLDYLATRIAHLEREAATDELTGLLNRRAGERRLHLALHAAHPATERLAVALLDVDGLKAVNDRWGHAAGDAALVHLVSVLARHLDPHGWTARWGGDEFLVVLNETGGRGAAETILTAAAQEVAATPLAVAAAGESRLGVSWGLVWPTQGESPVNVIARADAALYRAKHQVRVTASA